VQKKWNFDEIHLIFKFGIALNDISCKQWCYSSRTYCLFLTRGVVRRAWNIMQAVIFDNRQHRTRLFLVFKKVTRGAKHTHAFSAFQFIRGTPVSVNTVRLIIQPFFVLRAAFCYQPRAAPLAYIGCWLPLPTWIIIKGSTWLILILKWALHTHMLHHCKNN
jgi:hypothetical protein